MDLGAMAKKGYFPFPKAADCFVSYPQHLLEEFYPFAEMQSVYFVAPFDWTDTNWDSPVANCMFGDQSIQQVYD